MLHKLIKRLSERTNRGKNRPPEPNENDAEQVADDCHLAEIPVTEEEVTEDEAVSAVAAAGLQ